MEKEQLLCCPFCGTKNAHIKQNSDHFFYIVCEKDGCYVRTDGYLNRQSAIDFWNKRSEENKLDHIRDNTKKVVQINIESVNICASISTDMETESNAFQEIAKEVENKQNQFADIGKMV